MKFAFNPKYTTISSVFYFGCFGLIKITGGEIMIIPLLIFVAFLFIIWFPLPNELKSKDYS